MKSIKKISALVLFIIVTACLSVHAFGQAYKHEQEAGILHDLGLYDGVSTAFFDPDLSAPVNRETGIALLVKMFGKKLDAMSMTDSEAEEVLSRYTDKDKISPWAKKFIAYAVKTNMVAGDSDTTVSPAKPIDGKSYATMILRNLGYAIGPEEWKIALYILSEKGGLDLDDAGSYNKSGLIKDDIIGISYSSLSTTDASSVKLLDILIAGNVVAKDDAIRLGLTGTGTAPDESSPECADLPSQSEIIYDLIKNALLQVKDEVDLKDFTLSESNDEVFRIINQVVNENPEILYYSGCTYWSSGLLKFEYSKARLTALSNLKKLNARAEAIIQEAIKPEMSDYEKELAVHDYIINHTKYDDRDIETNAIPPESFSAYGVLVLGTGVCEGYAEAMTLIMDKLGIECIKVSGSSRGVRHAWNIIKMDGEYYQLDLTWDDPVSGDGKDTLRYDYFNVTDTEMQKDHSWDTENYPACTAENYNYFYYNGMIVKSYDEFYNKIKDAMLNRSQAVTLKIPDYDSSTYDVEAAVEKAVGEVPPTGFTSYSYSVNETTGIVTIRFI